MPTPVIPKSLPPGPGIGKFVPGGKSTYTPVQRKPGWYLWSDGTWHHTPEPGPSPSGGSPGAGNAPPEQEIRENTVSAAGGPIPVVYGTQRVGGRIFYINAFSGYLVVAMALCEGPVASLQAADVTVEGVAIGTCYSNGWLAGYEIHDGGYSQAVSSILSGWFGYTQSHPGLCYVVLAIAGTAPWQSCPQLLAKVSGLYLQEVRENMLLLSNDFTIDNSVKWISNEATLPTVATGISDPWGGTTATRWTAATVIINTYHAADLHQTDQYSPLTASIWLRSTNSAVVTLGVHRFQRSGYNPEETTQQITLTSTWTRYSVTVAAGDGSSHGGRGHMSLSSSSTTAVVELWGAQLECFPVSRGYVETSGTAKYARENLLSDSETFATGWTQTAGTPTGTGSIADPFNTTSAYQWAYSTGGPHGAYRVSTVPVFPGNGVTFSVWLRATSGTVALNLQTGYGAGSDLTTKAVTVTTTWQRFFVSHTLTQIGVPFGGLSGIPNSSTIQLFGAQLERAPAMGPYLSTATTYSAGGAAISWPTVGGSNNPSLVARDMMQRFAALAPTGDFDDESVGQAAAYYDELTDSEKRYTVDIAIVSGTKLSTWVEAINGHCGLRIFPDQGLFAFAPDKVLSNPVALNDAHLRDVKIRRKNSEDVPTRMVVTFTNKDKDWISDSVTAETDAVAAGTEEAVDGGFDCPGITSAKMAQRHALYLLRRENFASLVVEAVVSPIAEQLRRGSYVTLTTRGEALGKQNPNLRLDEQGALVLDLKPAANGEWNITFEEYDASAYSTAAYTADTPPSTRILNFDGAPESVTQLKVDTAPAGLYFFPPRLYVTEVSGTQNGSYWQVDLGADYALTTGFVGRFKTDAATGPTTIEYSDNGSSWSAVSDLTHRYCYKTDESGVEFHVLDWDSTTEPHRYWRANNFSAGKYGKFFPIDAEFDPSISHYELHMMPPTVGNVPTELDPIVAVIPDWLTHLSPFDLTPWVTTNNDFQGMIGPTVVAVRKSGTKSRGVSTGTQTGCSGMKFVAAQLGTTISESGVSTDIGGNHKAATVIATAAANNATGTGWTVYGDLQFGASARTSANNGTAGAVPGPPVAWVGVNFAGSVYVFPVWNP